MNSRIPAAGIPVEFHSVDVVVTERHTDMINAKFKI
jgi:hypothetical protein